MLPARSEYYGEGHPGGQLANYSCQSLICPLAEALLPPTTYRLQPQRRSSKNLSRCQILYCQGQQLAPLMPVIIIAILTFITVTMTIVANESIYSTFASVSSSSDDDETNALSANITVTVSIVAPTPKRTDTNFLFLAYCNC